MLDLRRMLNPDSANPGKWRPPALPGDTYWIGRLNHVAHPREMKRTTGDYIDRAAVFA